MTKESLTALDLLGEEHQEEAEQHASGELSRVRALARTLEEQAAWVEACEAALKQAMIGSARRVVALIDYSKFGLDHFARFARWSDIDMLITNSELAPQTVAQIRGLDTEVVTT